MLHSFHSLIVIGFSLLQFLERSVIVSLASLDCIPSDDGSISIDKKMAWY